MVGGILSLIFNPQKLRCPDQMRRIASDCLTNADIVSDPVILQAESIV